MPTSSRGFSRRRRCRNAPDATGDARVVGPCPLIPRSGGAFTGCRRRTAGDIFFDMEGDPLEDGGLEYLFGVWYLERGTWTFQAFWGHSRAAGARRVRGLMDFVTERRRTFPGAHVYHYASYEESALKRLASWHATREVEVDNLLREGVLVDLYKVVREGIRISEPSYSIKSVEHFYRPAREGEVQSAGASIVYYERWRETRRRTNCFEDIADLQPATTWSRHTATQGLAAGPCGPDRLACASGTRHARRSR